MGLQRIPYPKFGGLNLVEAPYDLDTNFTPDALNVRFVNPLSDAMIGTRDGKQDITSNAFAADEVLRDGIFEPNASRMYWCDRDDVYTQTWSVATLGTMSKAITGISTAGSGKDCCCMVAARFASGNDSAWFMPRNAGGGGPQKVTGPTTPTIATWANPPTTAYDMVEWRGRMVVCDALNTVRWSDPGNPESPTGGNWGSNSIDIYDDAMSRNTGLLVHNNNLYLMKQSSIWLIYDPNTFYNRLLTRNGNLGWRTKCSNPWDRRLYWFCPLDKQIHSSNGETDDIVETGTVWPEFTSLDASGVGGNGESEYNRMVVDPISRSVFYAYALTGSNPNRCNSRLMEITMLGKPGHKPVFIHTPTNGIGALVVVPREGSSYTGSYHSIDFGSLQMYCTDGADLTNAYRLFGTTAADGSSGFTSRYVSNWAPFISEEPMERIRRVSMIYRGNPVFDISSVPTPAVNPPVFTITPPGFAGVSSTDRTYVSLDGPQKKGRYHRFQIRGSGVAGEGWQVSALEFVIRGGKEKK